MNLKKTLVLALLLLCAVAYIVYVQEPRDTETAKQEYALKQIPVDQIRSIHIVHKGDDFTLVNTKPATGGAASSQSSSEGTPEEAVIGENQLKGWELQSVKGSELDRAALNSLLTALRDLKLDTKIARGDLENDLSIYGLKEPEATITVDLPAGPETMEIGKENEYVSKRYLRVSGQEGLYLISPALKEAVDKPKNAFRNALPVSFSDADVQKISIEGKGASKMVFEASPDFQWTIVEPLRADASEQAISELLRQLRNLKAVDFLEAGDDERAKLGLSNPDVRAKIEFKDATKRAPVEVAYAKSGDTAHFTVAGTPSVYKAADANLAAAVLKPVNAYRENHPVKFAVEDVTGAEFELAGGGKVIITKGDAGWTVNGDPADEVFVRQLMKNIATVTAVDFPAAGLNYGFDKPTIKATIRLAQPGGGEAQTKVLVVGSEADKKDGKPRYFAGVGDLSQPFVITDGDLKAVTPNLEGLKKTPPPSEAQSSSASSAPQGAQ